MADLMVGGAVIGAFLNVLFDRLASRQVLDFIREKKLDKNLFEKLETLLTTVSVVYDDAEAKEFTHPGVKQWLEKLKDATYHAEDMLDEIVTLANTPKKSIFDTSSFQIVKKAFDVTRVHDIVSKMELLASQRERLGLHARDGDRTSVQGERITSSLIDSDVYGRDDDKQKILESVLADVAVGDPIPVITIVGMGGIGKTTLAKIVFNDEKVMAYFPFRAWVCVTQKLDILEISKVILETITPGCSANIIIDQNIIQLKLKEMLTGKKILLVLDDVWNEDYDKWCELCAPLTTVSPRSKIIVTTRNHSASSIMRTVPSDHSLVPLSSDASWLLFTNHAFGKSRIGVGHPQLEVIGKQVVEKCKGLPLAIKLLGGVLRNKVDVKDWENVVKSEFWDLPIAKTGILPALRLSYHYLPAHLKPCFAYCSIFPQDYVFEKEKLVRLWMAECFVIENTNKSMEEVGEEYFDDLFSRSFFQKSSTSDKTSFTNKSMEEVDEEFLENLFPRPFFHKSSTPCKTYFVMHDLNNDLARDVAGKFSLAYERSKTFKLSEKVRHFSFSLYNYSECTEFESIQDAKYLRTFLPIWKLYYQFHYSSKSVIHGLVPKFSCMRVLSLSYFLNVNVLPDSVGTLIHLRYLDLSYTSIQSLPDTICQLYNLQTLNLLRCRSLIKLPTNLGELVNLRHLDIRGTSLNKLPPKIRKLESLQTLGMFVVGEDNCSGLGELNGLRHLKGSLSIKGLHNVKNAEDAIEASLQKKLDIEELSFEWGSGIGISDNHSNTLDNLQPSANVKRLTLIGYGGTRLSNWLGDGSLFKLTSLSISDCAHCVSLPSLGQLPSLVQLHLEKLVSVKQVDSNFYVNEASSIKPFQNLAFLHFTDMPQWEEWSHSNNDDFPKLEILCIEDCPKLCGNLPKLLPSLRDLYITECGELTAIIQGDASPCTLSLEGCKNVVFENKTNLKSLKSLRIGGIESNCFPIGMLENCKSLEELKIRYWSSLTHFHDEGLLPTTLKEVGIRYCENLEFLLKETFQNCKHLERLELKGTCHSMTCFPLGSFPKLKSLAIDFLEILESFSIQDEDRENLKSLQHLSVSDCSKFINFPSGGLPTPNLNSLDIRGCKMLKSLPEGMNTQLASLQKLSVKDCEQVESPPAGVLPSKLRDLRIDNCEKLMVSRREWDLHTLSSLEILSIGSDFFGRSLQTGYCEEIEIFPEPGWQLPTSITRLEIANLQNLKTIDASKLPNLHSLNIRDCPKVKFDSNLKNSQDLPASFNQLYIRNCPLMAKQLETRHREISSLTLGFDTSVLDNKDPVAK